jgi:hypothetical protein
LGEALFMQVVPQVDAGSREQTSDPLRPLNGHLDRVDQAHVDAPVVPCTAHTAVALVATFLIHVLVVDAEQAALSGQREHSINGPDTKTAATTAAAATAAATFHPPAP